MTLCDHPRSPPAITLSLRDRYREQAPPTMRGLEAYEEASNSIRTKHRAELASITASAAARQRRSSETVYVGVSESRIG